MSNQHKDRVRETLRCQKCGRVLAKVDSDGTVHIKPAKGPQVIASAPTRLMFVCENISYFTTTDPTDERLKLAMALPRAVENGRISFGIACGEKTFIEPREAVSVA